MRQCANFTKVLLFYCDCVKMTLRMSGVCFVSTSTTTSPTTMSKLNNEKLMKQVTIVTPQRSNSMDYLNFEQKRELIASSLSLSDFLHCNPAAAAAAAAKEVAATTVIVGK